MNTVKNKIKQSREIQITLFVALIIVLIIGVIYILKTQNRIKIDNSIVEAPISSITPSGAGVLKEVDVSEGEKVKKGDQLAVVGSEVLHAYSDGVVVMANQQVGGNVTPQTPIIQMINLDEMRIDGTIDENKGLDDIKIGQPVSFTVDALPGRVFWGYIDEVSPTAKQTQAAFSISSERPTQQFEVFARFDAPDTIDIKNGMSAKMIVYTKS